MDRRRLLAIGAALVASRAWATPLGPSMGGFAKRVFSAWNPKDMASGFVLSNKNLTWTCSTKSVLLRATSLRSSGKFYFELTVGTVGVPLRVGVANSSAILGQGLGDDGNGYGYSSSGQLLIAGTTSSAPSSFTTADLIGVAVDLTARRIYFAKNNVWQAGGDPASGTGGQTLGAGGFYIAGSTGGTSAGSTSGTLNVGASSFVYTAPIGFNAWG